MDKTVLIIKNETSVYTIQSADYVLGKSQEKCQGVITGSKAVSRMHCRVCLLENGRYGVMDLHSANGTMLNGYRLDADKLYELNEGDSLCLADVSFRVSYSKPQAVNRGSRFKDCDYKAVIFNRSFCTELSFDDMDGDGITLGTFPACMLRFEKNEFRDDFLVRFYCGVDGDYRVACSDNLYLSGMDTLSDTEAVLAAGHTLCVNDGVNGEMLFGITTEITYPSAGNDYDLYIDLAGQDVCEIGSDTDCMIRIDDARIGNHRIRICVSDGVCQIDACNDTQGLRINGAVTEESCPVIRENEFFEFYGYSFTVEKKKLYTSRKAAIITKLPFGIVSHADNHLPYPRFIRSVRQKYIVDDAGIEVLAPKPKDEQEEKNMLLTMMPLLLNMLVMVVLRGVVGGGGMFVFYCGATMLISGTVSVVTTINEAKTRKKRERTRRERYMEYVAQKEDRIIRAREKEKVAACHMHPDVRESMENTMGFANRLFEQDKNEQDYLEVRIGTGIQESVQPVTYKEEEYVETEDELMDYPEVLADKYQYLSGMPVMLSLRDISAAGFIGNRNRLYQMAKNLILQFAATHFYKDLKLYLVMEESDAPLFAWTRWLKNFYNAQHDVRNLMYDRESTKKGLEYLYEELSRREALPRGQEMGEDYVIFVYRQEPVVSHPLSDYIARGKEYGFHFLFFEEYEELLHHACEKRIFLHHTEPEGYIQDAGNGRNVQYFTYDYVSGEEARQAAMKLACVYVDEVNLENSLTDNISLYELLRIHTPYELDLKERWSRSRIEESMAAPLGVKSGDELVCLDIHEKAHGPHGLVAGTTGSGKSEIIQSYILSMATLYHPYEVGFVIIDFKGGGMANQFRGLPHLIGTITNMDGGEVERSLQSIKAELIKRQELFGQQEVNHIDDYIRRYREGKAQIALPHLILVVDEFAELKSEYPDFMKELISTARIGRSLGVHLILATQKPSGVVNEQIWSNSKFKLCLKVQNKGDSNEVIKSPLAAEIKEPGRAYLQVGNNEIFQLFQSAYSGAPAKAAVAEPSASYRICSLDMAGAKQVLYEKKPPEDTHDETQLEELTAYIQTYCLQEGIGKLPDICMPPLPERIPYTTDGFARYGTDIVIPVGLTDNPSRQTQYPELLDFSQGNIYIMGSAQSGKTNLLECIIRGLTTLYTPQEVTLYILDFASMILRSYGNLAHVGGIVTPAEDEKLKSFLIMLQQMITERKEILARLGLSSFGAYLESGASDMPQVVVLLDNWTGFKNHYSEYEDTIINISRECAAAGIAIVVTNQQSGGSGYKLVSNFPKRIALYCNDSTDYGFLFEGCRLRIPQTAGRGMVEHEKKHYACQFYEAFPAEKEYERIRMIQAYMEDVNARVPAGHVRRIPEMPDIVTFAYLRDVTGYEPVSPYEIPAGIRFEDVEPFGIDLAGHTIFGLLGEETTGKDRYAQAVLTYLTSRVDCAPLRLYILDDEKRRFEAYGAFGTYSTQAEDAPRMLDEIFETANLRHTGRLNGKEPEQELSLILVVIQSREAMAYMTKEKELAEKYRKLVTGMRDANVCFLYTNVENTMVTFGATEVNRQLKDARHFLLFEDLGNVKAADIPHSVARNYKKELGYMDAYYMDGSKFTKIKAMEDVPKGGKT